MPLGYHRNYTPPRDIVAKVTFQTADPERTREAKAAGGAARCSYVYDQDKDPLVQLRAALQNRLVIVAGAKSLAELDNDKVWHEFFPAAGRRTPPLTPEEQEQQFQLFHDALATPESLAKLERAVAEAMAPYEQHGLMEKLPQEHNEGNQQEIVVQPKGQPRAAASRQSQRRADWRGRRAQERRWPSGSSRPKSPSACSPGCAARLPTTLTLEQRRHQASQGHGDRRGAPTSSSRSRRATCWPRPASRSTDDDVNLLELEHQAFLEQSGLGQRAGLFAGRAGHVRRLERAVRRLRAALRAQAARQLAAVGHHAGPDRDHGRAVGPGLGRQRAGRAGAADGVRHDAVDRLSPRAGAAVFGRRSR